MQNYQFDLVKVCVFDFDGTLVDTMDGFADLAAELLEKYHGIPKDSGRSDYMNTSGIPFFQQLEIIQPGGKLNHICADEFETRKLQGFFEVAPSESTKEGLLMLRDAGYRLVVSSNNYQANLDRYLQKYELPVELALGFDGNGMEKGRAHFLQVQKQYGVTYKEILYCGDSLKDAERAVACGVAFIGKLGTFRHQHFQEQFPGIMTVSSILDLAGRMLKSWEAKT